MNFSGRDTEVLTVNRLAMCERMKISADDVSRAERWIYKCHISDRVQWWTFYCSSMIDYYKYKVIYDSIDAELDKRSERDV